MDEKAITEMVAQGAADSDSESPTPPPSPRSKSPETVDNNNKDAVKPR